MGVYDTFGDGFTDIGRNCGCGGVFVLVDQFHGKCGMCNATKLTMAGENKRDEKYRKELLERMQKERDEYNALHPGEA